MRIGNLEITPPSIKRSAEKPPGFVVPYGYMGFGGYTRSAFKFEAYVNEGFKANPIVYACCRIIAEAAKEVKIQLKRNGEVIDPERPGSDATSKLLTLLNRPNPNEAWEEFLTHWIYDLFLGGITYIQAMNIGRETLGTYERSKTGRLYLLRPDWVQIQNIGHEVTAYKYKSDQVFTPEEVLHLKLCDPLDEFGGHSPLKSAATVTDAHNNAVLWNAKLLENGGIPIGLMLVKGLTNLSDTLKEKWKAEFKAEYQGAKNAGKTLVMGAEGGEYRQFSTTPKDLDWLSGKSDMMRDICSAFLVPSLLLGDPGAKTYANLKEANKALYTTNVLPVMRHLCGELSWWLCPKYDSALILEPDTSDIDALKQDETERVNRYVQMDWLTINEKREAFGLERVEDENADKVLILFNRITLDDIGTVFDGGGGAIPTAAAASALLALRSNRALHPDSEYQTEEARALTWRRKVRKADYWAEVIHKATMPILEKSARLVAANVRTRYRNKSAREIRFVIADRFVENILREKGIEKETVDIYTPIESGIILDFGEAALADAKAKGILFDIERPDIRWFLTNGITERSKIITQTTADQLQEIITKGADLGEGGDAIAERILTEFPDMAANRAKAIARTETNMASNVATLSGYEQAGVEKKEWLSARDSRVRESHVDLDGQTVRISENFHSASGATGPHPGALGRADEDINCRCVMVPLIKGSQPI